MDDIIEKEFLRRVTSRKDTLKDANPAAFAALADAERAFSKRAYSEAHNAFSSYERAAPEPDAELFLGTTSLLRLEFADAHQLLERYYQKKPKRPSCHDTLRNRNHCTKQPSLPRLTCNTVR